jgi:hypothetical protein
VENVLKELDSAFRIISTIPVAGDHVEGMAAAKAKLRAAYLLVEQAERENKEAEQDGV